MTTPSKLLMKRYIPVILAGNLRPLKRLDVKDRYDVYKVLRFIRTLKTLLSNKVIHMTDLAYVEITTGLLNILFDNFSKGIRITDLNAKLDRLNLKILIEYKQELKICV